MSTCPRPDGLGSPAGYPSRMSRPSAAYARSPPPRVTTTARWPAAWIATSATAAAASGEALEDTVAHSERVRHRRQRRIHGADAGEDARVGHVEVVDLVRAAVGVEHRRRRVGTEATGPRLVGDAGHGDV